MKKIGSQIQETLAETDYELIDRPFDGDVILRDKSNGKVELWHVNNHYSGYVVKIGRWCYEFCRSFNGAQWSSDARNK